MLSLSRLIGSLEDILQRAEAMLSSGSRVDAIHLVDQVHRSSGGLRHDNRAHKEIEGIATNVSYASDAPPQLLRMQPGRQLIAQPVIQRADKDANQDKWPWHHSQQIMQNDRKGMTGQYEQEGHLPDEQEDQTSREWRRQQSIPPEQEARHDC